MDEVRTYEEVACWLPRKIRRDIELALPPHIRGWYTPEEAEADGGRFIEVRKMSEVEGRLLRTGD